MKKISTFLLLMAAITFGSAQVDFDKMMSEKITKLEQTQNPEEMVAFANDFDRIGKKNDSWLTYYYSAYAYVKKGRALMQQNKVDELDNIAAIAEKYNLVAMEKNPKSAEPFILQKMIHGLRMMVNPMQRYVTESAKGKDAITKAKEIDPNNPRITLLLAEDLYFTPEQYGGSKEKGLQLFLESMKQFKEYKTATKIEPNWGQEEAEYFIRVNAK